MLNQFGALVLPAVPLLVWVALLLLGRFPGERTIERLARRLDSSRRRVTRRESGARQAPRPELWAPAGGSLIAFGLGSRPPPVPA